MLFSGALHTFRGFVAPFVPVKNCEFVVVSYTQTAAVCAPFFCTEEIFHLEIHKKNT